MADQKIQLTVQVNAETGQLEVLGAKFDQVSGKAKDAKGAFTGLTKESADLLKSFLPFATAGGIIAFFTSAVKGAEEQNESMRRLQFTVESTGQSWEKSRQKVEDWSKAVGNATRFSDGEALNALDQLTRATGSLTQAQKASELAMGLASKTGKSLGETTKFVSDLINGNERAVRQAHLEYGVFVDGARTTQEVLNKLSPAFEKAAFNQTGLTTETHKMMNAFGQFKDAIGTSIIPALGWLFDFLTKLISKWENFASIVSANVMTMGITFSGLGEAIKKAMMLDFTGAKQAIENISTQTKYVEQALTDELAANNEKRKANEIKHVNEMLTVNQDARAREKAEQDQEEAELEQKQQERQQKILQQEQAMNQRLAQMGQSSLQTKLNSLNAEVAAEQAKNVKLARSKIELEKMNDKLNEYHDKQTKALVNEEYKTKLMGSLQIADLAMQTFATLNSMGNKHNEAEANRAKAILALEKAIAIARVWAAEAGKGALGIGIASATTALIVAQFAQQMKGIDDSRQAFNSAQSAIQFNSPLPGGGIPTDITIGAPLNGGGFTGGGGGGGGGAPAQFVITFNGDIIVTGVNGATDIADRMVDVIGEKLIERIKGMGQISFVGGA